MAVYELKDGRIVNLATVSHVTRKNDKLLVNFNDAEIAIIDPEDAFNVARKMGGKRIAEHFKGLLKDRSR